nr:prickle-like protein 4 isoform X1 [Anas platyrhynchos]
MGRFPHPGIVARGKARWESRERRGRGVFWLVPLQEKQAAGSRELSPPLRSLSLGKTALQSPPRAGDGGDGATKAPSSPGWSPQVQGAGGLPQGAGGALGLPAPNPLRVPRGGFDVLCSGLEGTGFFGAGRGAFCWWMKPTWGRERGAGLGSSPRTQEREHCSGLMGYSLLPAELGRGKKIPKTPPAAAALPPASKQATHRGSPAVTWMAPCRVAGQERSLGAVPQHLGCALSLSLLAANPGDGCARHPGTDPAPEGFGDQAGAGWLWLLCRTSCSSSPGQSSAYLSPSASLQLHRHAPPLQLC